MSSFVYLVARYLAAPAVSVSFKEYAIRVAIVLVFAQLEPSQ